MLVKNGMVICLVQEEENGQWAWLVVLMMSIYLS